MIWHLTWEAWLVCSFSKLKRRTGHLSNQHHHHHPTPLKSCTFQICHTKNPSDPEGCIFRLMCSHPELTKDNVLTSAYVKIFRTLTRNAINKSVGRKKDCSWLPLNKNAMNIWLSSLRIREHLSWRPGKHLHVLHVLRTYCMCSYPG